jgi:putative flippase GtrA
MDDPRSSNSSPRGNARKVSLVRGALCALPASIVGFVIPYLVFGTIPVVRSVCFGYSTFDTDADLRELPAKALEPAVGVSFVFVLAAFVNFAPSRRIGFVRALLLAGSSALLGLATMGVATWMFDLGRRSYTFDPYVAVRCAIAIIVAIVTSFIMLQRMTRHDGSGRANGSRSGSGSSK